MVNKENILLYLAKHKNEEFTMHELSKLVSMPYTSFNRAVHSMNEEITTRKAGTSILVHLNPNPVLNAHLIIASDEEKRKFLQRQPIIAKITSELKTKDIVLLFGSYAKRTQTEKSDIDLLIINKNGNKTVSFSKYEILFNKKINPIFVKEREFIKMINNDEENVGKQALQNHVILSHPEKFWRLVFNEF